MAKKKGYHIRKMDPCDYVAERANVLGLEDIVTIAAKDGKPKGMEKVKTETTRD